MKLGLAGFAYGLGLTVVGVFMAGAGHGTYLLLGVAAAPVSFWGILFSIVGPPILWGVVGSLLSHASKTPQRQIVVCVMLSHYLGIMLLPFFGDYVEGKYFERVWAANPAIVLMGGSLYLAGQVATWIYWIRAGRDSIQKYED
jgi:hypothetical protein